MTAAPPLRNHPPRTAPSCDRLLMRQFHALSLCLAHGINCASLSMATATETHAASLSKRPRMARQSLAPYGHCRHCGPGEALTSTMTSTLTLTSISLRSMGPICARPPDPEAIWAHGPAKKVERENARPPKQYWFFQSKLISFVFALRV